MEEIRAFSYGGGVQSTAALVLVAQGKINYRTFLFCNVGNDSENPATLHYVEQMAKPFAQQHGIEFIEMQKRLRDGSIDTIYQRLTRPNSRSIGIPVRMSNGSPVPRTCTVDFKVLQVAKWLKQHGATKERPGIVGLGISLDEFHRMRTDSSILHERLEYPLIDLRIDRAQCMKIIQDAGLPVPPKSSCWFCPFHTMRVWQDMRQNQQELFWKASELEQFINERRATIGKDQVWLSGKLKPLAMATTDLVQDELFDEQDACESGYCFV